MQKPYLIPQKKKQVDIYFILYLAALIILFSGNDTKKNDNEVLILQNNIDIPFRIKIEKPLLTCKIKKERNTFNIVSLDSTNSIWNYGDVENVRYEFIVEDQDHHNQKINLSDISEQTNKYFTLTEDIENRMVVFKWHPNNLETRNRTFNVYVTATGNSATNRAVLMAKSQFSLVIADISENTNGNDFVANTNSNNQNIANNEQSIPPAIYYPMGGFSIKPQNATIKGIVGYEWENEIQCYGFSPIQNLNKPPIASIENSPANNGGVVYNPIVSDNSIVIKGKIPEFGHSKVTITVVRSGDIKEATASFDIFPLFFGSPDFPQIMYPYIEYEFSPKLPNDLENISVYLKDKQEVRYSTFNNNSFKFKANINDVEKTFSFERYLNGQLIGQKYRIKVLDFPPPKIARITQRSKNEAILETVSFGITEGKNNSIKELKLSGNAKQEQLYGKTRQRSSQLEFYEQFSIVPLDNTKPFVFEAIAIDQRGVHSSQMPYSN